MKFQSISDLVVKSGRFLQLPLEAQALYFHLCIAAEYDGIVEAYPVTQYTHTGEKELSDLCEAGFIEPYDDYLAYRINDWDAHTGGEKNGRA